MVVLGRRRQVAKLGAELVELKVVGVGEEVGVRGLEAHSLGDDTLGERDDLVPREVLDDEGEELRVAIGVEDLLPRFLKVVFEEGAGEVVGRVVFDLRAREMERDASSDDGEALVVGLGTRRDLSGGGGSCRMCVSSGRVLK